MTTGGGGMIITKNKELYKNIFIEKIWNEK